MGYFLNKLSDVVHPDSVSAGLGRTCILDPCRNPPFPGVWRRLAKAWGGNRELVNRMPIGFSCVSLSKCVLVSAVPHSHKYERSSIHCLGPTVYLRRQRTNDILQGLAAHDVPHSYAISFFLEGRIAHLLPGPIEKCIPCRAVVQ